MFDIFNILRNINVLPLLSKNIIRLTEKTRAKKSREARTSVTYSRTQIARKAAIYLTNSLSALPSLILYFEAERREVYIETCMKKCEKMCKKCKMCKSVKK